LHCQRISRRAFVLGDSALGKLGRIETKPFGMALCRVVRAGCLDHGSPWITYEMQIKRPDRPAVERYRVGWWWKLRWYPRSADSSGQGLRATDPVADRSAWASRVGLLDRAKSSFPMAKKLIGTGTSLKSGVGRVRLSRLFWRGIVLVSQFGEAWDRW